MEAKPPFRFDGHGINDDNGQRICKVSSCLPYIYPYGQPQRNLEFDELSNLFAAAPELLSACRAALYAIDEIRSYAALPPALSNQYEQAREQLTSAIRKAEVGK